MGTVLGCSRYSTIFLNSFIHSFLQSSYYKTSTISESISKPSCHIIGHFRFSIRRLPCTKSSSPQRLLGDIYGMRNAPYAQSNSQRAQAFGLSGTSAIDFTSAFVDFNSRAIHATLDIDDSWNYGLDICMYLGAYIYIRICISNSLFLGSSWIKLERTNLELELQQYGLPCGERVSNIYLRLHARMFIRAILELCTWIWSARARTLVGRFGLIFGIDTLMFQIPWLACCPLLRSGAGSDWSGASSGTPVA